MNLRIIKQNEYTEPTTKRVTMPYAMFLLILLPSRNLGCFSIALTMTIRYTTIAKIGIVTINQSNSELILNIYVIEFPEVKIRSHSIVKL